MNRNIIIVAISVLVCVVSFHTESLGQQSGKGVVIRALEEEATRDKRILSEKADQPPYFIGYEVTESQDTVIGASNGALRASNTSRARVLDIDVRVGDYKLDNTHQLRGQRAFSPPSPPIPLPVEDDPDALKSAIWLATDNRYKAAVERLIQIKANRAVRVDEESTADFTRETPHSDITPTVSFSLNAAEWESKIKSYSALFNLYPDILSSSVTFTADATNKYFVNSEGTTVQHGAMQFRIGIIARTKADDGMELYRYESLDAHSLDRLPNDTIIKNKIEEIARDLKALKNAPLADAYTGPAILTGRASGVFFHEIFGHRVEGQRQKGDEEAQTFAKRINQSVLPDFISVYDDPTTERLANVDLSGYYKFDDEGLPARRVPVVENGVLKNFLMSRSPLEGFDKSNGHGRKSVGYRAAGRQGNLIVQSSKGVTEAKLREMLIDEAKRQGKPYGLLFKDISGGFTFTNRSAPQAFQVTPIMVYRVYTDNRPDELIRGVDLIGTPLTSFSKIIANGDTPEVFNGICGAESGFVLVSAVSPSVLTTQIEVQKKVKSSDRAPILPPPPVK